MEGPKCMVSPGTLAQRLRMAARAALAAVPRCVACRLLRNGAEFRQRRIAGSVYEVQSPSTLNARAQVLD